MKSACEVEEGGREKKVIFEIVTSEKETERQEVSWYEPGNSLSLLPGNQSWKYAHAMATGIIAREERGVGGLQSGG